MTQLQTQIPASVNIDADRTIARRSIRESVRDVKFTLVLTLCLVVAVIFLFLRNVSATLIPSLALPISVIGTFAVMYLLDYSLDNLSLMALTLAVGFVVDDAIVMLENIVRHMEMGKPPMQAAMDGAAEVGFTILSMTISLTAVFIPILFLGGIVGRLFHEFAVVIAVSILVSGFVSLTLTPMLSSRFLRPHEHGEKHGRALPGHRSRLRLAARASTRDSLEWVMNHRPLTMVFSFAILVGTVVLFMLIPKGFIPEPGHRPALRHDRDGAGHVVRRHGARTRCRSTRSCEPTRTSPASTRRSAAARTVAGTNQGRLLIGLKPRDERVNVDEMIKELRPKLAQDPGHRRRTCRTRRRFRSAGACRRACISSRCRARTSRRCTRRPTAARRRRRASRRCSQDVTSDLQLGNPQASVEIDRERAASLGVDGRPDRDRAVRRVRLAPGVDDLHAEQRVLGRSWSCCRSISTTCRR